MTNLLAYPEVKAILEELFSKLLSESGRGAVIIGSSVVEDHLTDFLEKVFPQNSNAYRNRLLKYPGALSSFSAKIELAYAFRLIDKAVYKSLNSLRVIRNKAAHNADTFSLSEFRSDFEKIFDLGPSLPIIIKNDAMKAMIELKMNNLINSFEELGLTDAEKQKGVEELLNNKEIMNKLEEQVPHWELILGLSLICGIISYSRDNVIKILNNKSTWGEQGSIEV